MEYIVRHFKLEEGLLKKWMYPEMNEHIQKNKDFTHRVNHMSKLLDEIFAL
ncbi:MAG: hypothetical protein JEZ08_11415 [Clostridiales bacterium]|nr:hypothetical protein [Clostridiales bacterium]